MGNEISYKVKKAKHAGCFVFCLSPAGVEPTAFRLGGERSILLSYEDIFDIGFILYAFWQFVKGRI